jgi:phosphatidylglycerophosphate synthase
LNDSNTPAYLGTHQRTSQFLLSPFEKRILPPLAAALPRWIKPDHMTILGLIAATGVALTYFLSKFDDRWLILTSLLIILNWFGDSLDGTIARVRKAERPRYGFYLDHITDAYSTLVIGLGLGLSPYMTLSVGLALVISYLLLSINVYLETHVFKTFSSSYGKLGPTEVRIMLIILNILAIIHGVFEFKVMNIDITVFDIIGLAAAIGMFILLLKRTFKNLKTLAADEPPRA